MEHVYKCVHVRESELLQEGREKGTVQYNVTTERG